MTVHERKECTSTERFCSVWSRMKTRTWFVARRYVKFWFWNTFLRIGLTWNRKTPDAATHLPPRKGNHAVSHPCMPKSIRWEPRLTTKRPRWENTNRSRRETAAKSEFTWFTYQYNVENGAVPRWATFVRFLSQSNILQNLTIVMYMIKARLSWPECCTQNRCPMTSLPFNWLQCEQKSKLVSNRHSHTLKSSLCQCRSTLTVWVANKPAGFTKD